MNRKIFSAHFTTLCFVLATACCSALAADLAPAAASGPAAAAKTDDKAPEAKVFVSKHQLAIGSATLSYTATAGTMLMKNDKDEPIALFGFTAYVKDGGDQSARPIVFAYNGGPGSSSAWLHMGILGPKRAVLNDLESNTKGPFRSVSNEFTVLDHADLVLIDPIGTGLSHPVGKAEGKDFWGVDQDIKSVSSFIIKYVSQNNRWASPKFVLGESYGGMRTAGVANALLSKNVALNGVILVSPFMDFINGFAGFKSDVPYVNFLTTYASTAWYHHALASRPDDLQPFLREVEAFARDVYAPVLLKGSRATAAERQNVLQGLARYTGVSADYWDKANLRLDESHFLQELLRSKGIVVGRIDSRYKGNTIAPNSETVNYDPYESAVGPQMVAAFNDYLRSDLKVQTETEYAFSNYEVGKDWDWRHAQPDSDGNKLPFPNTGVDLAYAMNKNPNMKVLIQSGYFDLACPYGAVEYVVDHLDIPQNLKGNIDIQYYLAGHMMYVHPESMKKFKTTVANFIDANSK